VFEYRIASTRESSAKYGLCEICGQWASEVFTQTVYRTRVTAEFLTGAQTRDFAEITGKEPPRILHIEYSNSFGHEACLIARRPPGATPYE
jgi:hypothetical protein